MRPIYTVLARMKLDGEVGPPEVRPPLSYPTTWTGRTRLLFCGVPVTPYVEHRRFGPLQRFAGWVVRVGL